MPIVVAGPIMARSFSPLIILDDGEETVSEVCCGKVRLLAEKQYAATYNI